MVKVQILLSTYNGENFLEEQVESILNQENVQFDILVRDDGSSDKTLEILKSYKKRGVLNWYQGQNLKPAKSFMDLVENADDRDFYAFSDQDDIWESKKIERALSFLQQSESDTPALYFSNTRLVDSDLKPLPSVAIKSFFTFEESLMRNPATGCTMVFNKKLLDYLKLYSPTSLLMHDSWLYQLCLALDGYIYFDENSYIKYRQHGNNVIGGRETIISKQKRRIKSYFGSSKGKRLLNAEELMEGYHNFMTPSNKIILQNVLSYKSSIRRKLKLVFSKRFRTPYIQTNMGFIISILFNKY